jgi:4-amino-4-deoxy-L-arabinose transferase-like glycosyltransferase
MMEIPLTFWTALSILAFLEGLRRRSWLPLIAVGVAGGILTKSVLGLLPVVIIVASAALVPDWRTCFRGLWLPMAALGL